MKCIICRKEKKETDFSDEHVIPDSLGGLYHIYNVCKKCNSYLGSNVDSKLVNHYFASFMRYNMDIGGKTGKIPNPFDGTHVLENDENTKVRMVLDDEGIPIPYLLPKIEKVNHNDKLEIKIYIDSDDKNKIDSIVDKILKRNGIDETTHQIIITNEAEIIQFKPTIKMTKNIDIKEFKIGLLKIAYEFAVDSIDEYFEDDSAVEISKFLLNPDYEKLDKYFIGSGFEKDINKPLELLFDFDKQRHLLVLMYSDEFGLICFIALYKLFNIIVKLSSKKLIKEDMIIAINDLKNTSFKKTNFLQATRYIYSNESKRFMYYIDNPVNYMIFLSLEQSKEFKYYMQENNLPIFNDKGDIVYNDINNLIEKYSHKGKIKYLGDGINHKSLIEFEEKLFLKVLPVNKLLQIKAVEVEQKLISKI